MLLIHGLTRSAELDWIEPGWPAALAAAERGAIAIDLPGHGFGPVLARSTFPVRTIIDALVATIDSTGQRQADVIGYSLGARLAWTLAATGRVRRLVLGGLSLDHDKVDVDLLHAVARGGAEAPDENLARLASWVNLPGRDRDTMCWLIEALDDDAFDPAVDIPTVPTLIVSGADDDHADAIAARLPDATYQTVPGDHYHALISPEFRSAAVEFVTGRSSVG